MSKNAMKRINIYLRREQTEKLKALADETGILFSEIIRRFIDKCLAKVERSNGAEVENAKRFQKNMKEAENNEDLQ